MKIKDTISFIESLINNTEKKSEIKFYKIFSNILKNLESLDLNDKQLLLIGNKIYELDLGSIQDKKLKYLKVKLEEFKKFLKSEISLIQEGYYIGIGMSLGMAIGIVVATSLGYKFGMGDETTGGLITGMVVGMFIGVIIESKAKKEKRIFKIT